MFSDECRTYATVVCNTLYSTDNFPISQGEASHKSLLSGAKSLNNLSSQAVVSPHQSTNIIVSQCGPFWGSFFGGISSKFVPTFLRISLTGQTK